MLNKDSRSLVWIFPILDKNSLKKNVEIREKKKIQKMPIKLPILFSPFVGSYFGH
jgi:hypothetical protein